MLNLDQRDGSSDLRAGSFENRRLVDDVDGRTDSRHFESQLKVECRADGQRQVSGQVGKSCELNLQLVGANLESGKAKTSQRVGDGFRSHVRLDLPRRHTGTRDDGSLRIGDTTADAGVINRLLGEHRVRARERSTQQCHHFPPHGNTSSRKNGTT